MYLKTDFGGGSIAFDFTLPSRRRNCLEKNHSTIKSLALAVLGAEKNNTCFSAIHRIENNHTFQPTTNKYHFQHCMHYRDGQLSGKTV